MTEDHNARTCYNSCRDEDLQWLRASWDDEEGFRANGDAGGCAGPRGAGRVGAWDRRQWPIGHTSGADKVDIGLKYEAYRNNQHETLVSVGLAWGIGHAGARGVGADAPNTILPGVFFGKGFGDLPDSLSWLRPFAVTAAFVDEVPVGSTRAMALAPNLTTGKFDSVLSPGVETLHWGFSIQYSTL